MGATLPHVFTLQRDDYRALRQADQALCAAAWRAAADPAGYLAALVEQDRIYAQLTPMYDLPAQVRAIQFNDETGQIAVDSTGSVTWLG